MQNDDDTPLDETEGSGGNVVQLDARRKEEQQRLEMEGLAGELAGRAQLEAVRTTVEFFTSDYLLNGYLLLLAHAKDNFVIKTYLNKVKTAIEKHPNANIKVIFDHALKGKRLEEEAAKQRRLAEIRANQLTIGFDDYEADKYAAYHQQTGLPLVDVINAQLALKHLGVKGSYNKYKEEVHHSLNDETIDIHALFNLIYEKIKVQFPIQTLETALATFAARHSYHPVKDYFDSISHLKPKGIIDTWLTVAFGAVDNKLNREIGKIMITAMVARTYHPGTKYDPMIVFEGEQGTGKSTALEILVGTEYFNSGNLFAEENPMKQTEAIVGMMMYESADLAGHKKADIDKVKAFLSKTNDRGRWVYDRKVKDFKRTAIFVGTTNLPAYLMDETGNRRFWPVKTCVVPTANIINGKTYVDTDWIKENRDQLWSEALALFNSGFSLVLDPSLWDEIAKLQRERIVEVAGIEKIPDVFTLDQIEGFNIIYDTDNLFEVRISSKDVMENVFHSTFPAHVAGRYIKSAMLAYSELEYGLHWEYKKISIGNGLSTNGYILKADGAPQAAYLRGIIKACREQKRKIGITSNAVTL